MKYLITGYTGQLGFDVYNELLKRGVNKEDILVPDASSMNLVDKVSVDKMFNENKIDAIFHCAAWTNVDGAEVEKEMCHKVNVVGTDNIIENAKKSGAKVLFISTDYVFDGTKDGIYTEDDEVNPQNEYGKSKSLAEKIVLNYDKSFVVRTSWVFGINGKNFIKTMIRLGNEKDELGVVCDQVGSPTYTVDLARLLVDMMGTSKFGLYHGTNEGYTSWADFARYIFKKENLNVKVNDILTKDYVQAAKRPLNSRLSKDKLELNGFNKLPRWEDAVDRYIDELKKGR